MFKEAPGEKIELLRRSFQAAEASVDNINEKKLRLLNNLITFTKYICKDLRNLPPALSKFLIHSGNKITDSNIFLFQNAAVHSNIASFPQAVFHNIQRFQNDLVVEEDWRETYLNCEKEIANRKDSELLKYAKRCGDTICGSLIDEKIYLEKNLWPWYENLHKAVKITIDAVYRNFAERKGYLQYLYPLEKNLIHALTTLKQIVEAIGDEEWKFKTEVNDLEKMEELVHTTKFAFAK